MKKAVSILIYILSCSLGYAQSEWTKGNFKVRLTDNTLSLWHEGHEIAVVNELAFNFVSPSAIAMHRQAQDSVVFKLTFDENDGFDDDFPAEIFLTIHQQGRSFRFLTGHPSFRHITINLKDRQEHYFGLIEKLYPNNRKNPDLRGQTVDVEVYAQGERDYAENYASAYSAFFMSSHGYGSFFDTFAKGRYRLGVEGVTEIYHQTGQLDWHIFYGPSGDKIHKEYYQVIGSPKHIPMWACGPVFWRDHNTGSQEILDDIANYAELQIPLTACFVDRPYSNGTHEWSAMDFNTNFANPEKWIKTINEEYGMEFMTWVGSLTFGDTDFPGLLPNYRGYLDLTHPDAVKEYESRLKTHQYPAGVKGHKMDRADENFPMTAQWHDPVGESETRNKYVYLHSKVIHDFLSRAHGKDQFNFARAAFHRCQPYLSAIWGGDSRSNWQGMAGNMANATRAGFMGFPVWGSDTGGYLGEGRINETLYRRWLQWSAWSGMFQVKIDGAGGSGEDRAPWSYPASFQEVYRQVSEQRMALLPYIYSQANTAHINGVMMKPLAYLYPDDSTTYSIWDEYVFGNAFLVAPVFSADNSREVYFPEGRWYDYYDLSKSFEGPMSVNIDVPAESIPVFVKANSIYLTGQVFQGSAKAWQGNLKGNESVTVHLAPGNTGDAAVFQYIDFLDSDKEKLLSLDRESHEIVFKSGAVKALSAIEVICPETPAKVTLNKKRATSEYDENTRLLKIKVQKHEPINLVITF